MTQQHARPLGWRFPVLIATGGLAGSLLVTGAVERASLDRQLEALRARCGSRGAPLREPATRASRSAHADCLPVRDSATAKHERGTARHHEVLLGVAGQPAAPPELLVDDLPDFSSPAGDAAQSLIEDVFGEQLALRDLTGMGVTLLQDIQDDEAQSADTRVEAAYALRELAGITLAPEATQQLVRAALDEGDELALSDALELTGPSTAATDGSLLVNVAQMSRGQARMMAIQRLRSMPAGARRTELLLQIADAEPTSELSEFARYAASPE